MEEIFSIILADGTVIDNLTLNGTNYVSSSEIHKEIFSDNCSPLRIVNGNDEEIIPHAELVCCYGANDGWHIAFRRITEDELFKAKLRADVDYLAMMTDTELEED